MKFAWGLGIAAAIFLHAVVLLFGGIFFMDEKKAAGSTQSVELLTDVEEEQKKVEEKKPEPEEELQAETEQPPDAAEILRNLEAPSIDDAPALEAASLSAIEAALSGQGGGGDFAESLSFASGGRIGGTGQAGTLDEKMEEAFSLAELDQKPRAIFQGSPTYPTEMRGKKLEGVVTLIFVVDAAGKVENPRVEKSSHTAFEAPALSAIKKWKFEPGLRAGQRVASKMRVSIRFPAG
ncbi:MAG: energy transducer TonB [Planctomycetes bacterium]|nr:energy transducer TonB [Planctomycetota bacterium]